MELTTTKENNSKKELKKNNFLLISNLNRKMNESQMKLFSYALLKLNFVNGKPVSEFTLEEVADLIPTLRKYNKKQIVKDCTALQGIGINLLDELFYTSGDVKKGKFGARSIIYEFAYNNGKFFVKWIDEKENIELLTAPETNPLVLDLSILGNLTDKGIPVYEIIKVMTMENMRSQQFSLSQIANLYKTEGKNRDKYKVLNQGYLSKAVEEINAETEFNISINPIKDGRSTVGVEMKWSVDKQEMLLSSGQLDTLKSMQVDFDKYNLEYIDNKEFQAIKKAVDNAEYLTLAQASLTIKASSDILRKVRKEVRNKQKNVYISDVLYNLNEEEKKYLEQYEEIFKILGKEISSSDKKTFLELIKQFIEVDRKNIAKLAFEISDDRKATSINYLFTTLNNWLSNNILTYNEALRDFDNKGGFQSAKYKKELEIEISDDFRGAMNLWAD